MTEVRIIEVLIGLNSFFITLLLLVIAFFIKRWIRELEDGMKRVRDMEKTVIEKLSEIKIAILKRHIECKNEFATKDDLKEVRERCN
ncbi:MAG: hypothetical protein FWD79_10615 [Desulfobulbus sp.]|nr:hypothetical protein [Desulfobulbus sp.]